MKKFSRKQWAGFIGLVGTSVLLITGLVFALYRKPIESAEVAAWVQAFGSVVAILAAIWISRNQERRSAADAFLSAELSAARMLNRTLILYGELQVAHNFFADASINGGPIAQFYTFKSRFEQLPIWSHDELVRMTPLPNRCAHRIASGLDCAEACVTVIGMIVRNPASHADVAFLKNQAKAISNVLAAAVTDVKAAVHELRALAGLPVAPIN